MLVKEKYGLSFHEEQELSMRIAESTIDEMIEKKESILLKPTSDFLFLDTDDIDAVDQNEATFRIDFHIRVPVSYIVHHLEHIKAKRIKR